MTENIDQDKKGAGVKFPPPLIFLSTIVAGYAMQVVLPLGIGVASGVIIAGSAIVLMALIVIILAALSFRRAKTHLEPWRPTSAIVSNGVFAVSRNPIYLALCLVNIGIGLILNSWWVLFSFAPAAILVYRIAIKPEEHYLESKFGNEYLDYKSRVRRWL